MTVGHPLWEKKEQIQHLSDAIIDVIQQEGLTNMEAIEALNLIITGLVLLYFIINAIAMYLRNVNAAVV